MEFLSNGSKIFIINGQPLLLQDISDNISPDTINADNFQHSFQEGDVFTPGDVVSYEDGNFLNASNDLVTAENMKENEFIKNCDNDGAQSITYQYLTLEQAAKLGLHFSADHDATTEYILSDELSQTESSIKTFGSTGDLRNVASAVCESQNEFKFETEYVLSDEPSLTEGTIKMVGSSAELKNDATRICNETPYFNKLEHSLSTLPTVVGNELSKQGSQLSPLIPGVTYTIQNGNSAGQVIKLSDSQYNSSQRISEQSVQISINNQLFNINVSPSSMLSYGPSNLMQEVVNYNSPPLTDNVSNNSDTVFSSVKSNCTNVVSSTISPNKSNTGTINKAPNSMLSPCSKNPPHSPMLETVKKYEVNSIKSKSVLNSQLMPSAFLQKKSFSTTPLKLWAVPKPSVASVTSQPAAANISTCNTTVPTNTVTQNQNSQISAHTEISQLEANSNAKNSSGLKSRTLCIGDQNAQSVLKPKMKPDSQASKPASNYLVNNNSQKPIGSTENPIKLVQDGHTFHSSHSLTENQLKQIAIVLQNRKLDKTALARNVLYDPDTNTKIIYRIVHPEEFSGKAAAVAVQGEGEGEPAATKRRGRPPKNRQPVDVVAPKMVQDEAKRKVPVARTRSGRLSRPPRHMVRDYRRLYKDDSDGAYSDYQSNEELEQETDAATNLLPGLNPTQKRNISSQFRCATCNKIYLGYQRMARHLDKYPDHVTADHLEALTRTPEHDMHGNSEEEHDMLGGSRAAVGKVRNGLWRRGRRKRKRNGLYFTRGLFSSDRFDLKEVMADCDDAELRNVAGPAVASLLTAWELLLLRVDVVRNQRSRVQTLCDELTALLAHIRCIASRILHQSALKTPANINEIKLEDGLCSVLGMPCGVYVADDTGLIGGDPKKGDATGVEGTAEKRLKREVAAEAVRDNCSNVTFGVEDELMGSNVEFKQTVDDIVTERLQNLTDTHRTDLCFTATVPNKSTVDDIISSFGHSDRTSEDLMEGLLAAQDSIFLEGSSQLSHRSPQVSASTEDLIKSLEHFGAGMPVHAENCPSGIPAAHDELDFDVLSRDYHDDTTTTTHR